MTQQGDLIGGKYEVIRELGKGGMSTVWLATDSKLNKEWAIKEIRTDVHDEHEASKLKLLKTEAEVMSKFDHPVLPRVTDIIDEGGVTYVVMDRVQGNSLEDVMQEQGHPFDYKDVVAWGKSLCEALSYLHGSNPPIIYRDMKPSNIMLGDDNTVKLIDFGTAKQYKVNKGDTIIAYTPQFAPPEQVRGYSSVRSDVYTLGATMHNLLTGWLPTEDKTLRPPIRELNGKLPEGLEFIIAKATHEDPDQRYQSCAEMKADLDRYEKLTQEFRATQEAKLRRFNALWIAAIACVVVGIACLALSTYFKNSTYEAYIAQAEAADSSEIDGQASEAESLYQQAIDLDPGNIGAYQSLVELYVNNSTTDSSGNVKGSNNFTKTEATRLTQLLNEHRDAIGDSSDYAKLCYDIGILYFAYFENDAEGLEASDDNRNFAMSGNIQASQWFDRAVQSYDAKAQANSECSLTESEYKSAGIYKTVGEFYDRLSRAVREGNESAVYEDYWDALEEAVGIAAEDSTDGSAVATIVRIRLYQIVYEALGSPSYLNGFRQIGVTSDQAVDMYHDVVDLFAYDDEDFKVEEAGQVVSAASKGLDSQTFQASRNLYGAAQSSESARVIYEDIAAHRAEVAANIETIYGDSSLFDESREFGSAAGEGDGE